MNHHAPSIENVSLRLTKARNNPIFRKKFPKELWNDILSLIKEHSFETVCKRLNLSPRLVSRKIVESSSRELRFKEVTLTPSKGHSSTDGQVIIEISKSDIKARIEGPVSCVASLTSLFKEG